MSDIAILEPTYATIGAPKKREHKHSINIEAVNTLIDKIKDSLPDDEDNEESDLRQR